MARTMPAPFSTPPPPGHRGAGELFITLCSSPKLLMTDDAHIQIPGPPADGFSDAEVLQALRIPFGETDAETMLASIRAANRRDRKRYEDWLRDNERRMAAGLPPVDPPAPESFWCNGALTMLSLLGEPGRHRGDGSLAAFRPAPARPGAAHAREHHGDSPPA